MRKTKIVCTLGPAVSEDNLLKELMLNGMNVARFNFSHSNHEEHKARYDQVRKLADEVNLPIATLLDTKGPEIRLKQFKEGKIQLNTNDKFILTADDVEGTNEKVSITFTNLPKDVKTGTIILIDDGLIELTVEKVEGNDIHCKVLNGGPVSNNKGVNVPGVKLSLPFMSEKDRNDIIFGCKTGFDFIAASFTRCAQDIIEIRQMLKQENAECIQIIAKIENADGIDNLDEILEVADGVMVARGDMGVEIAFEQIPSLQKMMIKKANKMGKHVITATQMLDSMMKNPRPTRAEATDVANAVYDGTSAIMLSGETAAGSYPIESVKAMAKIAEKTEQEMKNQYLAHNSIEVSSDVTNAVSLATVTCADTLNASAIITVTRSGKTARMIAKNRPLTPVVGCSNNPCVVRQLNLSWGVYPKLINEKTNSQDAFNTAIDVAKKSGFVESNHIVALTSGDDETGNTNLLKIEVVK